MARYKDSNINLPSLSAGNTRSWESIKVGLLMDIRDELKALNATLGCYRVQRMCDDIHRIEKRLQKHMPLGVAKPWAPK